MNLGKAASGRRLGYAGAAMMIALVRLRTNRFWRCDRWKNEIVPATTLDIVTNIDFVKAEYLRPENIPFPRDNPYTLNKARLGQRLFFDKRLSHSSAQSCASCHDPGFSWGDGLPVGVGFGMAKLGRRSPSIINAAWGAAYTWDGRESSLEEQVKGPIQSRSEMNMTIDDAFEATVVATPIQSTV